VRVHRNALVAKQYISGMAKGVDGQVLVQLAGIAEPLEVSRRHAAEIRRLVKALQN
jgi:two-component system response regulator AlgR